MSNNYLLASLVIGGVTTVLIVAPIWWRLRTNAKMYKAMRQLEVIEERGRERARELRGHPEVLYALSIEELHERTGVPINMAEGKGNPSTTQRNKHRGCGLANGQVYMPPYQQVYDNNNSVLQSLVTTQILSNLVDGSNNDSSTRRDTPSYTPDYSPSSSSDDSGGSSGGGCD